MKAGIVTDSYQYSAMAAARLGLRLCLCENPAMPQFPVFVTLLRACSHVLRFNRIFGSDEGQRSVNTSAFSRY
jgi:hypothetical protein